MAAAAPFFRNAVQNVGAPGHPSAATEPQQTFRLLVPQVAQDGPPAQFSVSALQAYQGGALRVNVSGARSGMARAFDRFYQLAPVPRASLASSASAPRISRRHHSQR